MSYKEKDCNVVSINKAKCNNVKYTIQYEYFSPIFLTYSI